MNIHQSTSFQNKLNTKQIVLLDIDDSDENDGDKHILGSSEKFNIHFNEPLIIDKVSELYLDNVITYNCNITNDNDNSAFVLNINEFNIATKVASNSSMIRSETAPTTSNGNSIMSNSIIIPNENDSIDNYYSTVIHKSRKLNYLADIPCGRFSNLSGNITNLNGDPIFHGQQKGNNYTYRLQNISWNLTGNKPEFDDNRTTSYSFGTTSAQNASLAAIDKNTEFILSTAEIRISCIMLNDTPIKSSTLIFSSAAHHSTVSKLDNASNVNLNIGKNNISGIQIENGGNPRTDNPDSFIKKGDIVMNLNLEKPIPKGLTASGFPVLRSDSGRFLCEFTIIEK
jgi:hypothetical protein